MRIYVACLASYNNGVLYGRWIDASDDVDAMQEEVNAMLRGSRFPNVRVPKDEESRERIRELERIMRETGSIAESSAAVEEWKGLTVPSAEEWAIHAHEGLGDLKEYSGLKEVARRVAISEVADERDIPLTVFLEAISDQSASVEDVKDAENFIDEHYRGSFDHWADFAEQFTEETQDMDSIPDWIRYHIDWDSMGREFEQSGDFNGIREGGQLYIFWAH